MELFFTPNLHLILHGRLEYEDLISKYFDICWLSDPLIKDEVIVVELDYKPRVGLLLRAW